MKPPDLDHGPGRRAMEIDARAEQARNSRVPADSAATRELSACLRTARLLEIRRDPWSAIKGLWQSYGMLWAPIASTGEILPTLLIPQHQLFDANRQPPFFKPQGNLIPIQTYQMRQQVYRPFFSYQPQDLVPAMVLALPIIPGLMAWLAMWGMHLSPLITLSPRAIATDAGVTGKVTVFMGMTYLYLALLSSAVEYGENMRFRLEVEPLIWIIALVTGGTLLRQLRRRPIEAQAEVV